MAVAPYIATTREAEPRERTQMPPAKPWRANRPGDLEVQPEGGAFGYQGPDQGYALRLASLFADRVKLAKGEHWEEVEYGAIGVACRRASVFGRAPVKEDVEIALLVWGFLPEGVSTGVVARLTRIRRPLFADAMHNAWEQRRIASAVPEEVLSLTPAEARARMAAGDVLVEVGGV